MAYSIDKNGKITINGFEQGIAVSPHKGIANLKGANIATETGEVLNAFNRVQQAQVGTTGTLTQVNTNTVTPGGITLLPGEIITITADGGTGLLVPFTPLSTVNTLVVAGGGGGGVPVSSESSGGGGAGGMITNSALPVTAGTAYTITVGTGGGPGTSGTNSVFSTLTAVGGGHGGGGATGGTNGGSGGGGGGGGGTTSGGTGTASQGNAGGGGNGNTSGTGGGGGAGAVGGTASGSTAGAGGAGLSSSISGSSVFYAGGGGGGDAGSVNGGNGGGGSGSVGATHAVSGTANTGGGGGGSNFATLTAGSGGSGVVIISYPTQTLTHATGGTITTSGGNTIHTFTTSGTFTVLNTTPIGPYYYYLGNGKLYGGTPTTGTLPPNDPDNATVVTGITSGTATFTITHPLGNPIQSATESYYDTTGTQQYRYYILDSLGSIWCNDTSQLVNYPTPAWFFVDNLGAGASGLAVYNGWITISNFVVGTGYETVWKITSLLGSPLLGNIFGFSSNLFHNMLVGHQGKLYGTDGNFVTNLFANTSLLTGFANIQSYDYWTSTGGDNTKGNISAMLGGSIPFTGTVGQRIPVMFYTTGTLPSSINSGVYYYIEFHQTSGSYFYVYSASSGGSALNLQTGATGKQYFNTFNPSLDANFYTMTYVPQALTLPYYEVATCLAEIGNSVLIGGKQNVIYPWDQVSYLPSNLIFLPENNTVNIITVNNAAYVFAGTKANIYITNGSSISPVITVPDYTAGIAGTPLSYIEPTYVWGGAMYLQGRLYFSVLDQTSTKAGQDGGIWSFIPTQNQFINQDTGTSLRLESQNSYGTYNGVANVLLANQNQLPQGPQYWTGWMSDITTPTYGIDFSGTIPQTTIIETDLIPTGTMLVPKTFSQIEYKLSAPLASGDSITINYRLNGIGTWTSCGTRQTFSSTELSGYYSINFQNTQWVQLQIIMTPQANTSSSFCRLVSVTIQ